MTLKQRLDEIRRIVKTEKRVVVSELSRQFDVTEETIRRDLDKLEAEGLVARTYGGAVLNQAYSSENVDFQRRAQIHTEEKRVIAALAASLIPQRATISADASSTVTEALRMLGDREAVTVLTYSVKAIENLSDSNIRLISTGGIINRSTCAFMGPVTRYVLNSYNTEYALISCKAINMAGGIYDSHEEEVELKKIMLMRSAKVILMADSSKFDRVAFTHLADLDRIHMLITDREPSKSWCEFLEQRGIELVYPQEEAAGTVSPAS